jgi:hypothetical protein
MPVCRTYDDAVEQEAAVRKRRVALLDASLKSLEKFEGDEAQQKEFWASEIGRREREARQQELDEQEVGIY